MYRLPIAALRAGDIAKTNYRLVLFLSALTLVVGAASVCQADESSGDSMARAAEKFLNSLNADQRDKAAFAFDADERFNWQFMRDRAEKPRFKGLPLKDMKAEQKEAAIDLLATATSATGKELATTLMSLESLVPKDAKEGGAIRDPEWYFFAVFGKPAAKGDWGWRLQGHHLSMNVTLRDGKVISMTPVFLGAEPAEVINGPHKGLRPFADADDLGKKLFRSLDNSQRKAALVEESFPRYRGGDKKLAASEPLGLAAAKMNEKQRDMLVELLSAHMSRYPADVAKAELAAVKAAEIGKVHFAYVGDPEQKRAYRIHGPTLLIEFSNEQDDSEKNAHSHVHSVWRNPKGDFGLTD
jgi:Protein of unknown function (DUF3500)